MNKQIKIRIKRSFYCTYLLILANIIFYIFMISENGFSFEKLIQGPSFNTIINFGAKQNGLIALGEIQRFFFPFLFI